MASLHGSASPFHSTPAKHRLGLHFSSVAFFTPRRYNPLAAHLTFRFKNETKLQVKERLHTVFVSNTNPPEESNNTESSDKAPGPPFLTILAGFVVFFVISWIIGSIVMWLISLIVHPPPFKGGQL